VINYLIVWKRALFLTSLKGDQLIQRIWQSEKSFFSADLVKWGNSRNTCFSRISSRNMSAVFLTLVHTCTYRNTDQSSVKMIFSICMNKHLFVLGVTYPVGCGRIFKHDFFLIFENLIIFSWILFLVPLSRMLMSSWFPLLHSHSSLSIFPTILHHGTRKSREKKIRSLGDPCWLLKQRWMGIQRVQSKRVLPWLVRWACHAGARDFCSALAVLVGPAQNTFSS